MPHRWEPRQPPASPTALGHNEKTPVYGPWSRPSPDTSPPAPRSWVSQSPELWEINFCWLSHPIYGFLFCVCAQSLNCVRHFDTPRTVAPPGSSVHGILQARTLEWVAISSSRGIFLTQGLNPGLLSLLRWQADASPGKPPRSSETSQQRSTHCARAERPRLNLNLRPSECATSAGAGVRWSRSVVSDSLRPHGP